MLNKSNEFLFSNLIMLANIAMTTITTTMMTMTNIRWAMRAQSVDGMQVQ